MSSSVQPTSDWLGALSEEVRECSGAIAAMIGEVEQVIRASSGEAPPTAWVDAPDGADVKVFLLVPGLLHEIRGPRQNSTAGVLAFNEEQTAQCFYGTYSITPERSYSVRLQRVARGEQSKVHEEWVFQIGGDGPLTVSCDPVQGEEPPPALRFARALAAEIAKARASG